MAPARNPVTGEDVGKFGPGRPAQGGWPGGPPPHARRDIYLVPAQPTSGRESEPHMRSLIEHVALSAGRAEVGLTDGPVELRPGDYPRHPGELAHAFRALEQDTVAVPLSEHRRRARP